MLVFKLTPTGKRAISEATIGQEIELTSVIITDEPSSYTVSVPSGLSGTVKYSNDCYGYISDNVIHLEFLDDSENVYTAKTLALIFRKSDTDYVFALSCDSDGLFFKTPNLLQAVIHVNYSDAQSVTIDESNISFPEATQVRYGSVRYASNEEISSKTGDGVIKASNLDSLIIDDYVDLEGNQTITGTKTFTSTIDGTVEKAKKDQNGNLLKTAATLDYVSTIDESAATLNTTIPNTKSVINYVEGKTSNLLNILNVVSSNSIGSLGLYFYTEQGSLKQIGSSVDGQYLKPVSMKINNGGELSFSYDNTASLSGQWILLSQASLRSTDEKCLVLAIKTNNVFSI